MTRYRLAVDVTVPGAMPVAGIARVGLPNGAEAWIEAGPLAPYMTRLDVAPPPPPAPPVVVATGPEYGAWYSGAEPPEDYIRARQAGLTWARIRWLSTGHDWQEQAAWAEDAIAHARAAGLRVLFEYWAWAAPLVAGQSGDVTTLGLSEWVALSEHLASRLGTTVAAAQLMNEPDLATPGMCPQWPAYVSGAARAWRRHAPGVLTVAPGMAMMPYAGARASEWARLRECAGDVDALAMHTYAEDLSRAWSRCAGLPGQMGALRNACGWSGPVWLTECGGISGPVSRWQPRRSDAQQAADTVATVQAVRAADVPVACFYAWRDQPGQEQRHGLCREDGTPKPALAALAGALR